jgi:hypothetical protein
MDFTRAFYPYIATSNTICKTFVMVDLVLKMQWNCLIIGTHHYGQPIKELLEYGKLDSLSSMICIRT